MVLTQSDSTVTATCSSKSAIWLFNTNIYIAGTLVFGFPRYFHGTEVKRHRPDDATGGGGQRQLIPALHPSPFQGNGIAGFHEANRQGRATEKHHSFEIFVSLVNVGMSVSCCSIGRNIFSLLSQIFSLKRTNLVGSDVRMWIIYFYTLEWGVMKIGAAFSREIATVVVAITRCCTFGPNLSPNRGSSTLKPPDRSRWVHCTDGCKNRGALREKG